jgi:hypothetical protein
MSLPSCQLPPQNLVTRGRTLASCVMALLFTAAALAQTSYTQDFQSQTANSGVSTGTFTYTKGNSAAGTTGPAISPPTTSSSSGTVGLLVIDQSSANVAAFADPRNPATTNNLALRIFDYSTASSGTNQSGLQQALPSVTSTATQLAAVSLSFDYTQPVTLATTAGSNEYLIIAFGAYTTSQALNSSGNRVVEARIRNDGTFGYSAAATTNGTLNSMTIPTGVNRYYIYVNSHNSQAATYTLNGTTYAMAPNSVDIWNYSYTTSTYTNIGTNLGMRASTSTATGADAELGIFGFFAAGSSSSGNVDFVIDNLQVDTLAQTAVVAPAITKQPASLTVAPGGNASFTVTGTGPIATYQWSFNGTALVDGTAASTVVVSGSTLSTLTLTGVTTAEAGNYTVSVINSVGQLTSSPAVLTVGTAPAAVAPTISTQPANATVAPGASATFTVVATGTPAPTYQWSKGGTAISGATNATYTIAAVAAADAGSYTVVAANSAGAATSNAATLTVSAASTAPTISTQPANVTVTAGASATFTVVATGTPTPTYQWKKAGTAISGATSATYTIAATAAADAGSYTVTVSNSAGSVDSSAATLTVNPAGGGNVAPTITTQPTSATVTVGGSATFTVVASGTPTPTYQWTKGGAAVSGATNASLTVSNAQSSDAGTYAVTVTNSVGAATSSNATLTVNPAGSGNVAPAITTQPGSLAIATGGSGTLTVVATSTPAPTYQWTKNGGAISGATNASLTISNAQSSDAGTYAVTVSNSVGAATSSNATVTVTTIVPVAARITNISGRAGVGGGNNALILGAAWNGASKPVIFRLAGPALKAYGLNSAITAPRLQLLANGLLTATNTGWDGTTVSSTSFAQVGAFPFTAGSKDAAIINNSLAAGSYVLVATNVDGLTGAGLGEIYDASTTASLTDRLTNVSVRAQVGSGDNILIAGFVISGTQSMPVVIRGIGPALNAYGLTGVTDPQLTLFGGSSSPVVSTTWDSSMTATFTKVGAFPLTAGSKDAAMIKTLAPGAYTITLTSVSGGAGSGLIEIYDAQ